MLRPRLEIAVQDAAGAQTAHDLGADRVELCSALEIGGLTPSNATVASVVATGIATHVLVRPRGGGFRYSATEVSVMVREIEMLTDLGVAGVVVGALTADGRLDRHALAALCRAGEPVEVTAHRCVDVLDDPATALDVLADLGVQRVLTSGGAVRAGDGIATLQRIVAASAGRVEVMAGGGVRIADIGPLAEVGVDAVHLSARTTTTDAGPAGPGGGPAGYDVTDPSLVSAAVAAVRGAYRG